MIDMKKRLSLNSSGTKTILALATLFASAGTAFAQIESGAATTVMVSGSSFLVAIVAGILLAFAFQIILTQFSFAVGISSIGDLSEQHSQSESSHWEMGHLTSTIGAWALITASISLFAATWLAVEISGAVTLTTAAILGLVIWSLFYIGMTLFETSALSSLVGSLVSTAMAGLRSVSSAGSGLFARSKSQRMADTAAAVAGAVHDEIMGQPEIRQTRRALRKYFSSSHLPTVDIEKVKHDLVDFLEHVELRAKIEEGEGEHEEKTLVASVSTRADEGNGYNLSRAAGKANQTLATLRNEYYSDKDRPSKLVDSILEMAGSSQAEAQQQREKVENFLISTGREELHPDRIKEELDLLLTNPKEGYARLNDHFSGLSSETLAAILARRTDFNQEEANLVVQAVLQIAEDILERGRSGLQSANLGIQNRIRGYLDSLECQELSYDEIYHDIEMMLTDPKSSVEVLKHRVQALDRDTLKSIIATRPNMTEQDAEALLQRIEGLRAEVGRKVEEMGAEIERRVEQARQKTLEVAESGRRQVATACWWAFATACISGIAAVLGGIAAIQPII